MRKTVSTTGFSRNLGSCQKRESGEWFRAGLVTLGVALGGAFMPLDAFAGYVWTENGEGNYSGTGAPWTIDESVEGKWVVSGTENAFSGDVNVTGGENFTIDGATVTTSSTDKLIRVEQGAQSTVFTIQNGGKLITSNAVIISDNSGNSTGTLNVDGGTLESTNVIRVGYHWYGFLNVTNGGDVSTTNNIQVGGAEARKGIGAITVGGLDSETNSGSLTASALTLGVSGPGDSSLTINRGTVTLSTLNFGDANASSVGNTYDSILTINSAGALTVSGNLATGNHAERRGVVEVNGGTLSARQIFLSQNAGTDSVMTLSSGTVTFSERMTIGVRGTAEVNISGGKLVGVAVDENGNASYKTIFVGGDSNLTAETGGVGVVNVSGGELIVNGLNIGAANQGTLSISGTGSVQTFAATNLGDKAGSSGTLNVSGGTLTLGMDMAVGNGGKGELNLSSGTVTGKSIVIYSNGNAFLSGGTILSSLNLNGGGLFFRDTQDGEVVSYQNISINNGTAYVTNAEVVPNSSTAQFNLNGTLDVGEGGILKFSEIFRHAQSKSATLLIHDGGQVLASGRLLVGDAAACRGTIIVDGAGSLLEGTSETRLGYHGSAEVYVQNGGTISGKVIDLGVNNNAADVLPSELNIIGKDSKVVCTTLNVGSNNQKSILNFIADGSGFGSLTAETLNRNTAKESEINLGLKNPLTLFQDAPEGGWQIVEASTLKNWSVNQSGIWEATVDGGNVTVNFADSKEVATLRDGVTIHLTGDLAESGWAKVEGEGLNILVTLDGVTDAEQMSELMELFSEEFGGASLEQSSDVSFLVSGVELFNDILAWDFNEFNSSNGASLALSSLSASLTESSDGGANVPEPASFWLLLVGILGTASVWRRQRQNR